MAEFVAEGAIAAAPIVVEAAEAAPAAVEGAIVIAEETPAAISAGSKMAGAAIENGATAVETAATSGYQKFKNMLHHNGEKIQEGVEVVTATAALGQGVGELSKTAVEAVTGKPKEPDKKEGVTTGVPDAPVVTDEKPAVTTGSNEQDVRLFKMFVIWIAVILIIYVIYLYVPIFQTDGVNIYI